APGAINVAAGNTGGVDPVKQAGGPTTATPDSPDKDLTPDGKGGTSLIGDAQPFWDDCSTRDAVALDGTNIGDELNAAGLSWGWFQGGFAPTTTFAAAAPGQATSDFRPEEFKSLAPPANASGQGLCDQVHPVGVALGET